MEVPRRLEVPRLLRPLTFNLQPMDQQDSNDCDEFERIALRVFAGLGIICMMLITLALGLVAVALLK